ncbi:hypothetical protein M2152_000304 [Microbacteriaceae bacterium SG_E_30_P1]|uniref:Asp23/Gls24 family envelope stress response protein n=1 Tax=Antiquaquibacter oligotrophicus TaxID=2880260 RepID=A0ABT6KLW4_9MICO|nr:hypothetical protein [Antiquaquibacter oligotrophicus]MDH6180122.1 hypothetical protein [Antiquaquibacter oligotrophicus]UDF14127.1 alkaline shock response membrane anchor protein AmaP [Antiquaquibacter oligotrophicus]
MTDERADLGVGDTGYTIEDLSAYLDRGRTPAIAAIDNSPECQAMLDSMERVGGFARDLVEQDVREHPALDEGWLGGLLASISREVRAGRDIPLASPNPDTTLTVTEGAVRELVRAAGDSVEGVVVGSCSLDGDVTVPGEGIRVHVTISVVLNSPVPDVAEAVRQRVYSQLLAHTELTIDSIDVTVTDVHLALPTDDGSPS